MRSNNREKVSPMVAFLAFFLHSRDKSSLESSASAQPLLQILCQPLVFVVCRARGRIEGRKKAAAGGRVKQGAALALCLFLDQPKTAGAVASRYRLPPPRAGAPARAATTARGAAAPQPAASAASGQRRQPARMIARTQQLG